MINNLNDFIAKYKEIKDQGWIQTHRIGPTGIGKTLEDLLEIPENNYNLPDFGDYELKSCRIGSQNMLTMFTKAPKPYRANSYLLNTFGYFSPNYLIPRKVIHETLSANKFTSISDTGHQLKINYNSEKIFIESENDELNIFWDHNELRNAFNRKFKNKLVYAKAYSRGYGFNEEFYFSEAYEMSGFSYEAMINLLEQGSILIDIRIGQYPNGKTHDHGTAFRIREADQPLLFLNCRQIV